MMRDTLARAAVAQWLIRTAKAGLDQAKADLVGDMLPGDRMHARIDGKDVATVTITDPKPKQVIAVTDEKAFTEWVAKNHPEVIVPSVPDWFSAEGNLKVLIAKSGEMPDGVEVVEKVSKPTTQVRISAEQEANLAALAAHTPVTRYITQDVEK